jgi:UDP-N-acetylmuramate--alanine ligase
MDDFATAFAAADSLILLDIYAASEKPIEGISAEGLAERIRSIGSAEHKDTRYLFSFSDAAQAVVSAAQPGDMILTLGAGNVSQLGPMILEKLAAKESAAASV